LVVFFLVLCIFAEVCRNLPFLSLHLTRFVSSLYVFGLAEEGAEAFSVPSCFPYPFFFSRFSTANILTTLLRKRSAGDETKAYQFGLWSSSAKPNFQPPRDASNRVATDANYEPFLTMSAAWQRSTRNSLCAETLITCQCFSCWEASPSSYWPIHFICQIRSSPPTLFWGLGVVWLLCWLVGFLGVFFVGWLWCVFFCVFFFWGCVVLRVFGSILRSEVLQALPPLREVEPSTRSDRRRPIEDVPLGTNSQFSGFLFFLFFVFF